MHRITHIRMGNPACSLYFPHAPISLKPPGKTVTRPRPPVRSPAFRYPVTLCIVLNLCALLPGITLADSKEGMLLQKVQRLEQELAAARAELEATRKENASIRKELDAANAPIEFGLLGGDLRVGGAMVSTYSIGDYPETQGASQAGEDGGAFSFLYRIGLNYSNGPWEGRFQYRWYRDSASYNLLHTAWLGYNFENESHLRVGVHRVPFGPGPYGISQSWFFDQHYYVGLADDMDLGIHYKAPLGNWSLDLAYYYTDEGTYTGTSNDSVRYSYDVVNESGNGYEERNQFNLRAIYHHEGKSLDSDLGFSLQYSDLESEGVQDDGDHFAGSVHVVSKWSQFTLAAQLSYYDYDVDSRQPLGTSKRVQSGAFDFPSTMAAEAWIPAVSLSYNLDTPGIPWLDYVIPYAEYSVIRKVEDSFNDSELAVLGAAWARGKWYIYTDAGWSNGNEFVGGDTPFGDRLGANTQDDWLFRFNIDLGYYF